jgi:hypothetical protein
METTISSPFQSTDLLDLTEKIAFSSSQNFLHKGYILWPRSPKSMILSLHPRMIDQRPRIRH